MDRWNQQPLGTLDLTSMIEQQRVSFVSKLRTMGLICLLKNILKQNIWIIHGGIKFNKL